MDEKCEWVLWESERERGQQRWMRSVVTGIWGREIAQEREMRGVNRVWARERTKGDEQCDCVFGQRVRGQDR
jgi:hypothetical protein